MAELPVVRVSIIRGTPEHFPRLRGEMAKAQAVLEPGISAMSGLLEFYVGADEATSSLVNVSSWRTLQNARQLDSFTPMLELGREFVAMGATFERPIMNYAGMWRISA